MAPRLYRLVVVWDVVQPDPAAPPDLDALNEGCMRGIPPCAAFAGVRDQLRAAASRELPLLVVFAVPPAWAQAPVEGCDASAGAGAVRASALDAYRALVTAVRDAAAEVGADLRYASPWNEPNHPDFVAPQRARCSAAARSLAAAPYVRLARALRDELAGDADLVLGEAAGIVPRSARSTSVGELIRALPRGVVCSAPVWAQHAYVGGTNPVPAVTAALAAKRCPREHAVWITETGVGPAPEGLSAARAIESEAEGCRLLHRRLEGWYRNPDVTLAVQYTVREDDRFPTGLGTTDLSRPRAALAEWQAWGERDAPSDPPPAARC
jgi:hypothetical protein